MPPETLSNMSFLSCHDSTVPAHPICVLWICLTIGAHFLLCFPTGTAILTIIMILIWKFKILCTGLHHMYSFLLSSFCLPEWLIRSMEIHSLSEQSSVWICWRRSDCSHSWLITADFQLTTAPLFYNPVTESSLQAF